MTSASVAEDSYILGRSQTQSTFSETSSIGDTKQLVTDEPEKDDKSRSGIPMTSFNMVNSIVGSGVIGIPYAFKQSGFALGVILLIVTGIITDYSILLLVEGGRLSNTDTYQDVVLVAFGRPGFYLLTLLQFLYPFIAMISYNVVIGDTITKVLLRIGGDNLVNTVLVNRQFIIFLSTLLVNLPLSLYRDIAKLSKWACASVLLILFIIICVCVRVPDFEHVRSTPDAWDFASYNFAQSIGIMTFAYMCHHNTFLIHESLENPTERRWKIVTHMSVVFAMAIMLVIGIVGYATFTGYTQGDLLENYCEVDDLMNVARFIFAITIMMTYPVECFVTRHVIENAFFASSEKSPLWRHFCITAAVAAVTVVVSMSTDCLGIVLTFNGVAVACPIAFILPPICVMKLRQEPVLSKANILPIFICVFGIIVFIVGFTVAIINLSEGIECSHGKEMFYCKPEFIGNGSIVLPSNFTL